MKIESSALNDEPASVGLPGQSLGQLSLAVAEESANRCSGHHSPACFFNHDHDRLTALFQGDQQIVLHGVPLLRIVLEISGRETTESINQQRMVFGGFLECTGELPVALQKSPGGRSTLTMEAQSFLSTLRATARMKLAVTLHSRSWLPSTE